jgi:hypothetical protein
MTRFRIVPYSSDRWKVQDRWLFFWMDCKVLVGPDYYERVTFASESDAEQWIDRHLQREREYDANRREAARRAGHYVPREYPPTRNISTNDPKP